LEYIEENIDNVFCTLHVLSQRLLTRKLFLVRMKVSKQRRSQTW